ncbi:unnamed protein product [Medioppia subpectinata]|uniref:Uncharacterized protein n=1 Tax=Medioppia subpectinata TaxID=1979941 RepID=A0A7R9KM00_9ACAR|nr:unnamed protein product [Medioppia subpectinata]CAG2104958.1 unnamed protein product [Medioppia subpectinata]
MTLGSETASTHRLFCSIRTRFCELESVVSRHHQNVCEKLGNRSSCLTKTSILRNPYVLLVVVCYISYWPSIWGQLVLDDRPAIIDNKDLRPNTPLYRLFENDFWGTPLHKVSVKMSFPSLLLIYCPLIL